MTRIAKFAIPAALAFAAFGVGAQTIETDYPAVGAAVGFSLPATRYEGELLGEYSQQVLDKAQTAASGLVDKVKTVAGETVQTAQESFREEAKAQGLVGDTGTTGGSTAKSSGSGTKL